MTDYREILKQYWGYDSFRGIQEAIITSIGDGRDTLGLMPTGGGKSITFQVPALAQPGLWHWRTASSATTNSFTFPPNVWTRRFSASSCGA